LLLDRDRVWDEQGDMHTVHRDEDRGWIRDREEERGWIRDREEERGWIRDREEERDG
jgi:hypothetical protein